MKIIQSSIDASVNFVDRRDVGFVEARYVRRSSEYFTAYVSSQTGCNRGCRMCHLTTSRQMAFVDCTKEDYLRQTETIIECYRASNDSCQIVHVAFMARGEALANRHLIENGDDILRAIGERLLAEGLTPKFNVSTIMPKTFKTTLVKTFPLITPTIYYSLYSVDPDWRAEWLPGAMEPQRAFDLLCEYQAVSKKIIKIHGAFIAGENDGYSDVDQMVRAIERTGLRTEFNIVAYNPASPAHGAPTPRDRLEEIADQLSEVMPVKIVLPVGRDCGASCGSFYPVHDLTRFDHPTH